MSSTVASPPLADAEAREQALDTGRSFIVQAPAGSGKTELLTQRFLALLSKVDEPEQILAITFTRAATAEMRNRILRALEAARLASLADEESRGTQLAREALAHAEARGWKLLDQPHRLNIQTIDSLALTIAHQAPLLSRLGGRLTPTENAEPLYTMAARRTLELLGGEDAAVSRALDAVLRHRDTSLADCERLIAGMLRKRDQWLGLFPLGAMDDAAWERAQRELERPVEREHARLLDRARKLITPDVAEELLILANYACGNDAPIEIHPLRGLTSLADLSASTHWECACHLLLTKEHEWRKSIDARSGFPPTGKQQKADLKRIIEHLSGQAGLLETLCALRSLPPVRYSNEQSALLRHIFTMLLRAVAELRLVFAEAGEVDFPEISLAARAALSDGETIRRWTESTHHLLVDEFQDTSRPQFDLLTRLISEWNMGEDRTCFLVGDPMQSIYLFRQAEVEFFAEAQERGLPTSTTPLALTTLELRTNFRSERGVLEPLNTMFETVFSASRFSSVNAVKFSPATPAPATPDRAGDGPDAVHIHTSFLCKDADAPTGEGKHREAAEVLDIVTQHLPRIEAAKRNGDEYRLAVLVRARHHLALIADQLRRVGIPFRSVEIETLRERQEVLDLVSLVRALTHPMDRIAWLSILRAPWCGLSLGDLHTLCGDEERVTAGRPIPALLGERADLLSDEGRPRAQRVAAVLRSALALRSRGRYGASPSGFAAWIEETWEALGGPACVDSEGLGNTRVFFRMLARLSPDGLSVYTDDFNQQLDRLFALPDPAASERHGVQLMTIHKAKGLGFDVVVVPALERGAKRDEPSLLCWTVRKAEDSAEPEVLLAPIGRKGHGKDRHYCWVEKQKNVQAQEERKRLLYVACSRAKTELHLFGTALVSTAKGTDTSAQPALRPEAANSLLATGWPYLEAVFQDQWQTAEEPTVAATQGYATIAVTHTMPANVLQFPSGRSIAAPTILPSLAAAAEPHRPPSPQLWRLPADWTWQPENPDLPSPQPQRSPRVPSAHEPVASLLNIAAGTREARVRGIIIHALLEEIAGTLAENPAAVIKLIETRWRAAASALLRHHGIQSSATPHLLEQVMQALATTLNDPVGRWLLTAHNEAHNESAWDSRSDGMLLTVRADRIFLAGDSPGAAGDAFLWIVDYKTTDYKTTALAPGADLQAFLSGEWERHAQQLEQYSHTLRSVYPNKEQRLALYYPLLSHLDWRPVY